MKAFFTWIIALIIIAFLGTYFYLGIIVKKTMEDVLPSITGTAVKISSVKISLIDGNASIEGMEISNPNGFGNTPAFAFDKIYGSVNLYSIFSNQIIINKINIDSPMVSVIVDTNGINLNVIKDNIQNYLNSSSNTTSANTSSKSSKSLVVKSLDISNAKLFVVAFG